MTFKELKIGEHFIDCGEVCTKIEPTDGPGANCTVNAEVYFGGEKFAVECENGEVETIKESTIASF